MNCVWCGKPLAADRQQACHRYCEGCDLFFRADQHGLADVIGGVQEDPRGAAVLLVACAAFLRGIVDAQLAATAARKEKEAADARHVLDISLLLHRSVRDCCVRLRRLRVPPAVHAQLGAPFGFDISKDSFLEIDGVLVLPSGTMPPRLALGEDDYGGRVVFDISDLSNPCVLSPNSTRSA